MAAANVLLPDPAVWVAQSMSGLSIYKSQCYGGGLVGFIRCTIGEGKYCYVIERRLNKLSLHHPSDALGKIPGPPQ